MIFEINFFHFVTTKITNTNYNTSYSFLTHIFIFLLHTITRIDGDIMKLIKKAIKFCVFVFITGIAMGLAIYGYGQVSTKLEIRSANNISLYDKDGNLYFQGNGTNEWIALKDISKNIINATIATEDKNFYSHFGFDFLRIVKAGYTNLISGKTVQGASTISQQYVKNLFLDFDKTWERKWNELWLTLNVENHYTKDEILEGYLNTIS